MLNKRRVVITGVGVATPLGLGIEDTWDALLAKKTAIGPMQGFDASALPASIGGELPAFKLADYIPKSHRKSAKLMCRDIEIAVVCAYQAVKHAGLVTKCMIERGEAESEANVDPLRFGVNIGAGLIPADLRELTAAFNTAVTDGKSLNLTVWGEEGMTNLTPLWLLKFLPNMLACHVTIVHDAQAPCNTITCGEASGHLAIGEAFRTIARGDADVCICGGVESKTNPMGLGRQIKMDRINTQDNDNPALASQPFGNDREGLVISEGGGMVIIESLDHAQSRKARILGELVGFGSGHDIHHWQEPCPAGEGTAIALRKALADANINPDDVDLMNPFGTGIAIHDDSELAGWRAVFGSDLGKKHAATTRGSLGINGAGSGAIDFAVSVMALFANTVPPSQNTEAASAAQAFGFVSSDSRDADITAMISLGRSLSGGQRAALVVKKFKE